MTTTEPLKQSLLAECDDDHVELWAVVRDVEEAFPHLEPEAVREHVLELLGELLVAGEIQAGYPTPKGDFHSMQATPEEVLRQIEADWPSDRRPSIGDGLWFTKADESIPTKD